ncbi:MAG: hypothetical protein KR126chlam3_01118 [Chlamydiae bacterium]|nr:hypothetical protein [Chlamydiota bacterium]
MNALEISSKQKWENAHKTLNSSLKMEISMMREVLANLHQEELSLLENDHAAWAKVMCQRSEQIVLLRSHRFSRMDATVELTKCAVLLEKKEMLPHNEESSCEILSKLDQLIALLDRINLQNCRNEVLFHQRNQKKKAPLFCPYPHPLHKTRPKTRVATFTQKG